MLGERIRWAAAMALAALATSSCTGLNVSRAETFRAADPKARPGGKLVIGIAAPASIDPGNVSDASGGLISSLVCEPLMSIDPVTGRIAHGIVESVVIGGQGSVFTLKLRSDVEFHNGKTVTAQDVVYALSRVARHDYAGAMADVLRPIVGFAEIHAPPPPTETEDPARRTLAGVRAISKTALEVALTERNADFIRAMTLPMAAPVPRDLPEDDRGFGDSPVCAGPYRMARPYRRSDRVIELRRFQKYYGHNDGFTRGGAGYPDVIEFRIAPDRGTEMRDFRAGLLDMSHVPPAQLAEAAQLGSQFMAAPLLTVEFVGFPSAQPSFRDVRVRAMLNRAVDRTRLVSEVYAGGRLPAERFLPISLAPSADAQECTKAVEVDDTVLAPARATRLQFKVNDDFANRSLAEAIARQWREKLSLDVEVIGMTWDKYLTEATGGTGMDAFFRESWTPTYPSIDGMFHPLFHSSQIGNNNFARFNNRTFDRRLDRIARREVDDEVRLLKYLSLEQILCRELPLIPVTSGQEEYLVRVERLGAASGRFFDAITGQPLLREWFIR